LATPLSTIAIVARELEDQLTERRDVTSAEDARLIREQVERCRDILLQMAADAGESMGEPLVEVPIETLVETALHGLPERERVRLDIAGALHGQSISTPLRSVAQALRAVVKNALEASRSENSITVSVSLNVDQIEIEVADRGSGMTANVLDRVGEPFFTTKGPDRGMGLGLFLTRTIVERLGGRLNIESEDRRGTRVRLVLPRLMPATNDRIADATVGASF
jgi:two-component system sensor histidine kinase RegB